MEAISEEQTQLPAPDFRDILQFLSQNLESTNNISRSFLSDPNVRPERNRTWESQYKEVVAFEKKITEIESLASSYRAKFEKGLGSLCLLPHSNDFVASLCCLRDNSLLQSSSECKSHNVITKAEIEKLDKVLCRLRRYCKLIESSEFHELATAFATIVSPYDRHMILASPQQEYKIESKLSFIEMIEHLEKITQHVSIEGYFKVASAGFMKKLLSLIRDLRIITEKDMPIENNIDDILEGKNEQQTAPLLHVSVNRSLIPLLKRKYLFENIELCMPSSLDTNLEIAATGPPDMAKNMTDQPTNNKLKDITEDVDDSLLLEMVTLKNWMKKSATNLDNEDGKQFENRATIFSSLAKNKTLLAGLTRLLLGDFFQGEFDSVISILDRVRSTLETCEMIHEVNVSAQNTRQKLWSMKTELTSWSRELHTLNAMIEDISCKVEKSTGELINNI